MENILKFILETTQIGLQMFSLVCLGIALTFLHRIKKDDKKNQKLKDQKFEEVRRNAKC